MAEPQERLATQATPRAAGANSASAVWPIAALALFALANAPLAYVYALPMGQLAPYRWIGVLPLLALGAAVLGRHRFAATRSDPKLMPLAVVAALGSAAAPFVDSLWLAAILAWLALAVAAVSVGGPRRLAALAPALGVLACGIRLPADLDGKLLTAWNAAVAAAAGKILDLAGVYYAAYEGAFMLGTRRVFVEEACLGAPWLLPAFAGIVGFALASRASYVARTLTLLSAPFWIGCAAAARLAGSVYFSATRGSATDSPTLAAVSGTFAIVLAWLLAASFLQLVSAFTPRRKPTIQTDLPRAASRGSGAPALVLAVAAILVGVLSTVKIAANVARFFPPLEARTKEPADEFGLVERREARALETGSLVMTPTSGGLEELRRCYRTLGWSAGSMRKSVLQLPGAAAVVVGECAMTHPLSGRSARLLGAYSAPPPTAAAWLAPAVGPQRLWRAAVEGALPEEQLARLRERLAEACRSATAAPAPGKSP